MHNIKYLTYDEHTSREKIKADVFGAISRSGDGYGTDRIQFLEAIIYESYNAAAESIRSMDTGWYGGFAVKYYDFSKVKDSKKVEELEKKIAEVQAKKKEYYKTHSVKSQKAAYIGCPECGSKLNKDRLWSEKCPLCHTDLRAPSTLDRLAGFDKRIKEYEGKIEQERMKNKKQAKVKWLVKFEYHS